MGDGGLLARPRRCCTTATRPARSCDRSRPSRRPSRAGHRELIRCGRITSAPASSAPAHRPIRVPRPPLPARQRRRRARVRVAADVDAAVPQRDRRRARLRAAAARRCSRASSAGCRVGAGRLRRDPGATTHRWVRRRTGRAAGRSQARGHVDLPAQVPQRARPAPRGRAVLRARPARARSGPAASSRAKTSPCSCARASGLSRARARDPSVRRRRLGRLPLPVGADHPRLRADRRPRPPAAAGAPDVRGPRLRRLQLRAAPVRLRSRRGEGAVPPRERRLRRGALLLRRRLHEPRRLRHRRRVDQPSPAGVRARPAARQPRAQRAARTAPKSSR